MIPPVVECLYICSGAVIVKSLSCTADLLVSKVCPIEMPVVTRRRGYTIVVVRATRPGTVKSMLARSEVPWYSNHKREWMVVRL